MTTEHMNHVHKAAPKSTGQATIRDVVNAIDRQTEVIRSLFAWEDPPEEVLERVKAETLEKAALVRAERAAALREAAEAALAPSDDLRDASTCRVIAAELHARADAIEAEAGEDRPVAPVQPSEAPEHPRPATDPPGPAQALADLTPCLGDRVRVSFLGGTDVVYGYYQPRGEFRWVCEDYGTLVTLPFMWTVLEHLDPVTPEEPPVGSGMLVDDEGDLWKRDGAGWKFRASQWSTVTYMWEDVHGGYGPFRPATTTDLARHGVGEDGEPVGKGEADWHAETRTAQDDDNIRVPRSIFPSQDTLWTIADELDEDHAKVAARIIRDLAEQFALAQIEAEVGDRG